MLISHYQSEPGTTEWGPKCGIVKFPGGHRTWATSSYARPGETAAAGGEAEANRHAVKGRDFDKTRTRGKDMGIYVSFHHDTCPKYWLDSIIRNHKPSDSDLEDDSDEEDDDDPSTWFEDDQEDGIKGQHIVQPDSIDDLSSVIRVDSTKLHYSSFYEPRDNDWVE
jgi:hypothetical protein